MNTCCAYECCQSQIVVQSGHRHKQYCNDTCRQAAHRLRKQREQDEKKEHVGSRSQLRQTEHEIQELRQQVEALVADRAEWVAWKEAEVIGHSNIAAVRQYLQDHLDASIPVKRNGVVVRIDTLGNDGMAVTDYGMIRLSDDELEQARLWVCKKTGTPVIVTRVPIGSQDLEEQHAKYVALQEALKQANKKVINLERQVQRFERMNVLQSRESMLHDLMVLGGRLKYASCMDLGIGEGIDQWLAYVRTASDQDLATAIAHGYFQADRLAMAAIEASGSKRQVQMQQRIRLLESDLARRDTRIAELEHPESVSPQPSEVSALLYRLQEQQLTVERQQSHIEELESEMQGKIDRLHKLEESHSSTMFTMNNLLAAAQAGQREENLTDQQRAAQLSKDLDAVRVGVADETLLATLYGQALLVAKEREREVQHLQTRISKQYERRIVKQQTRIQEMEQNLAAAQSENQALHRELARHLPPPRAILECTLRRWSTKASLTWYDGLNPEKIDQFLQEARDRDILRLIETAQSCYFFDKHRNLRIAIIQEHLGDGIKLYHRDLLVESMDAQGYAIFADGVRCLMDTEDIKQIWAGIVGKQGKQRVGGNAQVAPLQRYLCEHEHIQLRRGNRKEVQIIFIDDDAVAITKSLRPIKLYEDDIEQAHQWINRDTASTSRLIGTESGNSDVPAGASR